MMVVKIVHALILLGGIVGLGLFGYSLSQQTEMQAQINQSMAMVNDSIGQTGAIVQQTSDTLQPLYETTRSLAEIELQEEATVTEVGAMNDHLARIATSERGIISGLASLDQATLSVSDKVTAMGQVTNDLLDVGASSKTQATQEAGQVAELNRLTGLSIAELRRLNSKLAALRLVPY
ncbi:MAG TPA: hypothetical protein VFV52_08400 [Bacilli bacterium]|nr:hypothetical protein [Bacilli bacterium]